MMIRCICKYDYPRKQFFYRAFKKIEYFKDISYHLFNEIYYTLKKSFIEKGKMLLKEEQDVESVIIVESGELEMYTEFDGNEFNMQRLP